MTDNIHHARSQVEQVHSSTQFFLMPQLQDRDSSAAEMLLFVNATLSLADQAEDSHGQRMEELWRTLLDACCLAQRSPRDAKGRDIRPRS